MKAIALSRFAAVRSTVIALVGIGLIGTASSLATSRSAVEPTRVAPAPPAVAAPRPARVAAAQDDPDPSTSIPVVSINVTQYGFEAPERALRPGTYLLVIRNVSGEESLEVTVRGVGRANGQTAKTYVPPPGGTIDLPVPIGPRGRAARYVAIPRGIVSIDVASRPDWLCRITAE